MSYSLTPCESFCAQELLQNNFKGNKGYNLAKRMDSNANNWVTWVFSGIGVAAIGWFGTWFHGRFIKKPQIGYPRGVSIPRPITLDDSSNVSISNSKIEGPVAGRDVNIGTYINSGTTPPDRGDEYHETPTPADITADILKASLYLRDAVGQSHVGNKVRWRVTLNNIHPRDEGKIGVSLRHAGGGPTILADVVLEDYPKLKTVRGKEPLEISGRIQGVQGNAMIILEDAILKFLALDTSD
jgi:hypothetical protein